MTPASAKEMRPERLELQPSDLESDALLLRHSPLAAGTRMMAYIPSQWEAQGKFVAQLNHLEWLRLYLLHGEK